MAKFIVLVIVIEVRVGGKELSRLEYTAEFKELLLLGFCFVVIK